ncbi:transcriptional regulator BetI [compost metagenome]
MAERGEARREAILAAATRVLAREGAHGFRLRGIAAEAGLGLSHVQYYFTSLDALLSALVDRYLADWDARLGETARDLPSAIDAVLDSQTQGEDCRLLWELWAMSSRDPAADAALTRFYAAYLDRVADLASAARPDLAPDTARDCAVLIVALIEGLSILRGAGREAALAPHARTQVHAAVEALILSAAKPPTAARSA